MQNLKRQMIAEKVKNGRMVMCYSQQELANATNISLRSIQRIEKAQVSPRPHTLKVLSEELDFSLDFLNEASDEKGSVKKYNMLYAGGIVVVLLLAWAYIAQSSAFPETTFELLVLSAITVGLISFFLHKIFS